VAAPAGRVAAARFGGGGGVPGGGGAGGGTGGGGTGHGSGGDGLRVQIFGNEVRIGLRIGNRQRNRNLALVVDRGPEPAGAQDRAVDREPAPAAEQVASAVRVARRKWSGERVPSALQRVASPVRRNPLIKANGLLLRPCCTQGRGRKSRICGGGGRSSLDADVVCAARPFREKTGPPAWTPTLFSRGFPVMPVRSQVTLQQALAGLAAQDQTKKPDRPMLLKLAEHVAIRFALDSYERGESKSTR